MLGSTLLGSVPESRNGAAGLCAHAQREVQRLEEAVNRPTEPPHDASTKFAGYDPSHCP